MGQQRAPVDIADRMQPRQPGNGKPVGDRDWLAGPQSDRLQTQVPCPRPAAEGDEDLLAPAPDAGAQPGELSPADGSGPRELLAYRSAQGRWVVAAMILGSSVAGIDSTVVAVALPAIGRNLHAGRSAQRCAD